MEELKRCFNIVARKLIEKNPELLNWLQFNFGDYLDNDYFD